MQSQTAAEILLALVLMFERLIAAQQWRGEDIIRRSLPTLGEHVLTAELDVALAALARALDAPGQCETLAQVGAAQETLRACVGQVDSWATRPCESF